LEFQCEILRLYVTILLSTLNCQAAFNNLYTTMAYTTRSDRSTTRRFLRCTAMPAQHIQPSCLLSGRPVGVEFIARQSVSSDDFRRLLKTHLFTLY